MLPSNLSRASMSNQHLPLDEFNLLHDRLKHNEWMSCVQGLMLMINQSETFDVHLVVDSMTLKGY